MIIDAYEQRKAEELWAPTLLGGNWNNGANAGAFYFNLNNAASNSDRNIGTHLLHLVHWMTLNTFKQFRPAAWQNIEKGRGNCAGRAFQGLESSAPPHMKVGA